MTTFSQGILPQPYEFCSERVQCCIIAGHAIVLVVSSQHRFQPLTLFGNGDMHASLHLYFQSFQFGTHTLFHRLPQNTEFAVACLTANMSKPQKDERLRFCFPSACSIHGRILAKFNQTGFLVLQFQVELLQSLFQFVFETLGCLTMFKACNKVSGPREFHPRALSEPDMNLSAHPAPIIQP